jgi:hypothetical protein
MRRGLIVLALHLALVLSLVAKYSWDRARLPRAWARTQNYDPNLPVRGRYASLRVVVPLDRAPAGQYSGRARLVIRDRQLQGLLVTAGGERIFRGPRATAPTVWTPDRPPPREWTLDGRIAFFLPEHAADPTVRQPDEELWVELSVPPKGMPRPVRLGVKKNGVITPIELR